MSPEQSSALELSKGVAPTPKNIGRVAQEVGDEAARWAFTQWEMRKRARSKFALADQMLFDRDGIEMATHERVAKYHASFFPDAAPVADLCCGIGGDLIALAKRGAVIGYESDPVRAEYAQHNLNVHGLSGEVIQGAADIGHLDCEGVFLDPQRRGREDYGQPDPRELRRFMERFRQVVVRLGTAFDLRQIQHDLFPHVEAVSFGGECRELLSVSNANPGGFAFHVESGESLTCAEYAPTTDTTGEYFFHADPAAIKAGCLGALCEKFNLESLGDSDGYLTGRSPVESPWLRSYRVVHSGNADRKKTQTVLNRLRARVSEVKSRGTKEPADAIRAQFKPAGARPLTLAVWPTGKSLHHTLIESLPLGGG